jgi:plasmid stability protein
MSGMKTTLNLPDALVQQVRLRARQEGRTFNNAVAELLRKGLAAESPSRRRRPAVVTRDEETGLPLIVCVHPARPDEELTPERVAAILLAQDAEWHDAGGR